MSNSDTKFKKGQSGNPNGRPTGSSSIKDQLRKIGEEYTPEELIKEVRKIFHIPKRKKITIDECMWRKVYIAALNGKPWAINFIADRREGKAPQTIKPEGMSNLDKLIAACGFDKPDNTGE